MGKCHRLVCEITETTLLTDAAAGETIVRGLNDIGCKVALVRGSSDRIGAGDTRADTHVSRGSCKRTAEE